MSHGVQHNGASGHDIIMFAHKKIGLYDKPEALYLSLLTREIDSAGQPDSIVFWHGITTARITYRNEVNNMLHLSEILIAPNAPGGYVPGYLILI